MEKGQNRIKPGLFIKTFGCQMNEYDSEKMFQLLSADYRTVDTPEEASLVLVNTCSVREKGEHKLFSLLGELRDLKRKTPELLIGVGGCVAQQEGREIIKRNGAVDFVVGTHNLSLIPALVKNAKEGHQRQVAVDYREEWEELPEDFDAPPLGEAPSLIKTPVRALVAIQRGCNKRCSFCVVPTTRGPEVSRDIEEIIREVRAKARTGAREIMLLGQTVNSYGRDLTPRRSFAELIRRVAEVDGVERIRFTSPHPADVREDFLELYSDVPQLCPHIHLPLQSGSDSVLRAMNRNYKISRYLEIVSSLRERVPDIALSTDIIVGFPAETESDFEETLNVIREVRYHSAYYFKYSRRPNTVAIDKYTEQLELPEEVKDSRFARLHTLQQAISNEINATLIGTTVPVLVEGRSSHISSRMRGRTPHNTLVEYEDVAEDSAKFSGKVVNVLVEAVSAYGVRGVRVCG